MSDTPICISLGYNKPLSRHANVFFIPCELPEELSLAGGVEESDGIYWTLVYTVSASAADKDKSSVFFM